MLDARCSCQSSANAHLRKHRDANEFITKAESHEVPEWFINSPFLLLSLCCRYKHWYLFLYKVNGVLIIINDKSHMTSLPQIIHWVRPCFHTNVSRWKLSTLGWTGISSHLDKGSKSPQPPFPWKRWKPAHGTIAAFSSDGFVLLSVPMSLPHTNTLTTNEWKQQRLQSFVRFHMTSTPF